MLLRLVLLAWSSCAFVPRGALAPARRTSVRARGVGLTGGEPALPPAPVVDDLAAHAVARQPPASELAPRSP